MTRSQLSRHARGRRHGQALVEFVVVAVFFLVPLLLAAVALGKFADVRHTALMAARYAAWERTVWYDAADGRFDAINGANRKSAAQIRNEIAVRLLNDRTSSTVIRAGDRNAAGFANGTDPMWRDNEGRVYLAGSDQLAAALAHRTPAVDVAGTALAAIGAVPSPAATGGTLAPPVPADTLAVADVSFQRIAAGSQAYRRLWPRATVWLAEWRGLDVEATGAILSNTWSANGAAATARMVAASVPTAQGLGSAIGTTVNAAKRAWDPGVPEVDLGKIAPDVVPADRLRP